MQSPANRQKRNATAGLVLRNKEVIAFLILAVIGIAAITALPWHMDEYVMFHRLACWDPIQRANTFRESCESNGTSLGPFNFHRSYAYIGIASSLLLAPAQSLWDNLLTNQLLGILFLGITTTGTIKSFSLKPWAGLILIAVYPLSYSVIHDGGPIRISIATIAWTPFLLQKFTKSKGLRRQGWAALCSALWLLSTEDKPFFLYLLPGTFFMTVASYYWSCPRGGESKPTRAMLAKVFFFFMSCGILCIALLIAMRIEDGSSYLIYLKANSPSITTQERLSRLIVALRFLVDWPYHSSRIIEFSRLTQILSAFASIGWAACIAMAAKHNLNINFAARATTYLLFISSFTLLLSAWIAGGLFHHHFAFAILPLAIIVAIYTDSPQASPNHTSRALRAIYALFLLTVTTTATAPKYWYSSTNFLPLLEKSAPIMRDGDTFNCGNWGCYYGNALSGNFGHPVVFADSQEMVAKLAKESLRKGTSIVHLCWNCSREQVKEKYQNFSVRLIAARSGDWGTWSAYKAQPQSNGQAN